MSTIQLTNRPGDAAQRREQPRAPGAASWALRALRQRARSAPDLAGAGARAAASSQSLSDHMLRDIGLTRADVFAEATKPFWRP